MIVFFKGTNTQSAYIYGDSTGMSCVPMGDKIFLSNFYTIPFDVGRYDWHPEVTGPVFHETRAKDSR